jgi:hypothetical protein
MNSHPHKDLFNPQMLLDHHFEPGCRLMQLT